MARTGDGRRTAFIVIYSKGLTFFFLPLTGFCYNFKIIIHLLRTERNGMDRLVALPFGKSVEIAYKSIRVRFFRSLITTLSLVLAIAFLCYVQTGNLIADAVLKTGDEEVLRTLDRAGYDIEPGRTSIGGSAKQRWIIVLSLLVCVVGIVNAQLMAVTERFREIGTMKCLGALNHFILRLFMLEAFIQGIVGSAAGALLGAGFAVIASSIQFGALVFSSLPYAQVATTITVATAIGCFLSLIGVTYPAIKAAQMEPVEAMRVEE